MTGATIVVQQLDPDLRALQEMRDMVLRAKAACEQVRSYDQAQIDRLCEAMAKAALAAAYDLARLTVEETGIGRVHYKVLKNIFGSEGVWNSIKDEKTVGIVNRDEAKGVYEVATPIGVIAGIVPTTNPACTTMYKALISVKGRNAIVISPHPRAKRCINETVEIMRRAIERAGGPPDLVVCLTNPTLESTGALMKHRKVSLILATGGGGLVRAAYSSGKPAYGVGPGNVPLYVDRSADVREVAKAVVTSQSFDNATLCCSEQALVLDRPIADALLAELKTRGAHLCNEQETQQLAAFCNTDGHMNADVVGLDPWKIAAAAGFHVPQSTSVLLAHQGGVGKEWPLSIEILCPLLSVHIVDGWRAGCEVSMKLLHFGGLGHTLGIHARDEAVLEAFFLEKPASRIVVNGPTSQGAVGFSTNLMPAMSLGCGPQAGNITSDNITAKHMVNLKRVAQTRRDWSEMDRKAHERASAMTGQPAPRGSGMPGDPALGAASASGRAAQGSDAFPSSNWMGNPVMGSGSANARAAAPQPQAITPPARPQSRPQPQASGIASKV
ncbi:MAG: acetaldehyde dehydrogenase (acetylating), partial [Planctomycetota bacterium]